MTRRARFPWFSKSGVSLVETLLSVAIFVLLSAMLYTVICQCSIIYNADTALVSIEQQARNAMTRIVMELHQSNTSTAVNNVLTFKTPNLTVAPGVVYQIDTANADTKRLNDLIRTYNGQVTRIATNITSFIVVKTGTSIRIDIQTTQADGTRQYQYTLSENVRMRNE